MICFLVYSILEKLILLTVVGNFHHISAFLRVAVETFRLPKNTDGHVVKDSNDGRSQMGSSNFMINLIINNQLENVNNCYYKYRK